MLIYDRKSNPCQAIESVASSSKKELRFCLKQAFRLCVCVCVQGNWARVVFHCVTRTNMLQQDVCGLMKRHKMNVVFNLLICLVFL